MEIDITQVRRDIGSTVSFDLNEEIDGFVFGTDHISFNSPLHVQIKVHNTGKLLLVIGTIQTELLTTCGRCLEEFIYPLNLVYEDEWVLRALATEDQMETAFLFDKDEIEIGDRIIEQIVLAFPMRFICSIECLGLCPSCGVNRNLVKCACFDEAVDSRFTELTKWRSKD